MGCCDCGLVHDVEFRVIRITKQFRDGGYEWEECDPKKFRVHFKARRNNRSTAAIRRGKQKKP